MSRVTLTLRQDERDALVKLAVAELRNPRDQARHILRRELERRGLLHIETAAQPTDAERQAQDDEGGRQQGVQRV